jgi:hypothetical protein
MSENTNTYTEADESSRQEDTQKDDYSEVRSEYEEDAEIISDLTTGLNYEQAKEKYQENLSTAITFLVFGVAGIAVLVLNGVGVLKFFSIKNASGILMTVALGVMFIIFTVIGILSFRAAIKGKKDVKAETDNSSKILAWLEENVTAEDVDGSFDASEISEEMKFFERSDYIKSAISAQFEGLSDEFTENLAEQYIEKIF